MGSREKKFEKYGFKKQFKKLLDTTNEHELCDKLGVSASAFRQWINGYTLPTSENLIQLSQYFGVSTDYLLGLSDYPNEEALRREMHVKEEVATQMKALPDELNIGVLDVLSHAMYIINKLSEHDMQRSALYRLCATISLFSRMIDQSFEMYIGSFRESEYFVLMRYYEMAIKEVTDQRDDLKATILKKRDNDPEIKKLFYPEGSDFYGNDN